MISVWALFETVTICTSQKCHGKKLNNNYNNHISQWIYIFSVCFVYLLLLPALLPALSLLTLLYVLVVFFFIIYYLSICAILVSKNSPKNADNTIAQ